MKRTLGIPTVLLLTWLGQGVLHACGDKFFLVGRGDRFSRAYASLHPGYVVIYTGGSTEVSKGLRDPRLQKYIDRAGHRVALATDRDELRKVLESNPVDVVLAGLGQAPDLAPQLASSPSKATLLPIEGEGADTAQPGSASQFPTRLKSSDRVNRFLSGIEDVMKTRMSAKPRS